MGKTLSKLFSICGIFTLIFAVYLSWERNNPERLAFTRFKPERNIAIDSANYPTRLIIASAKINLPILPAKIKGTRWEDTKIGASYLLDSPLPGNRGNSIIYGHNWNNLLGPLIRVRIGDEIIVKFPGVKEVSFTVKFISVVAPDQVEILKNSQDRRLTVYTCTGLFDNQRLVVTAIAGST